MNTETLDWRKKALLIAGPTASGKSALALDLAQKLNGVIINADSIQVYGELTVLSARPSVADQALAPHRLYGFHPMADPYSVADWLDHVRAELAAADDAGRRPIIVGGTGLYFQALTQGLAPVPDIPPDIRDHIRARAREIGPLEVHRELEQVDPVMAAALRPTDSQRLVRALEVIRATGRSLDDWQRDKPGPPILQLEETHPVVLIPGRADLYQRINLRFDQMMEGDAALDEVRRIAALGLDPSLPAMKALGLPQLMAHLAGKVSLAHAVATAKTVSRRYAKRQMTWFRNQTAGWRVLEGEHMAAAAEQIAQEILDASPDAD